VRDAFFAVHLGPIVHAATFASLAAPAQLEIVDAIYADVALSEDARCLRGEKASKRAIRRHLSALPGLDRAVTKKLLAPPPPTIKERVLSFLRLR
jgi:hypothetical protein